MVEPYLYLPVYLYTVAALCILVSMRFISSNGYQTQEKGAPSMFIPLLICIVYIVFLGERQTWSSYFGDTSSYARVFNLLDTDTVSINWNQEWLWVWLMMTVKNLGLDFSAFLLIVETGYFITCLLAIKRLTPENIILCLMFVMSSLMFYTFGINGIRNGLACHIILLGISFMLASNYVVGSILFLAAFGIHRSTMLPIAGTLAALFVVKDVKWAIYFWLSSIVLSLFAGGWFTNFFAGLGFDDRMASYTTDTDFSSFSRAGFRWDFLLYSAMPVLMAWFVCVKRQISDNWYNCLCTIYCFCNAFWVLVIRSAFSNRFAYLSWFIYPFVIAYPLIMLPVWEDQDQKTAIILYAYVLFTIIMNYLWHNL